MSTNNIYGSVMSPMSLPEKRTPVSPYHAPKRRFTDVSEMNLSGQADVTIALFVHPGLLELRKNAASDPNKRPLGTAVSPENLAVKEDDLMVVQKNWAAALRMGPGGKSNPWTFSAFNGIDTLPNIIHTEAEFEENFVVVGRSKFDYSLSDPNKHNRGQIAIQISGSGTIRNNGSTSFNLGDLVRWSIYSLDPAIRSKQISSSVTKGIGEPQQKLSPILEKQTYTSMYRLPQRAISRYLNTYRKDAAFLKTSFNTALNGKHSGLDLFILAAMRDPATKGLMYGISVLIQAGVLSVNPLTSATIEQLSSVTLDELNSKAYVAQANGTVKATETQKETIQQQEKNYEQLMQLGKLLGAVSGGQVAHGLVDAIIMRQNRGLMEGPDTMKHRENASILNIAPANRRKAANDIFNQQSVEKLLERDQLNCSRNQYAEYYQAYMASQQQVFAKAIGPAEPGQRLDVLFG